jgi:DNA modification methylase
MTTATITTGDCIDQLAAIPPGTVDLVVADPPYNIGIDYGDGERADRLRPERYVEWTRAWIDAAATALAPNGSLWIVCGQEYAAHHDLAIQAAGLTMRNRVTWYESFGVNCRNKFSRTSRPIFYAVKHPRQFTFNAAAVRVPSARATKYRDKRAAPGGKIMDDVWGIPRVCGTFRERLDGFPTQLPMALVERIVLCSSDPGHLVVDPFAGSGTTGVVCIEHGRRFLGFELRDEFARAARRRLEQTAHAIKENRPLAIGGKAT